MPRLRIAQAQINPTVGDMAANAALIQAQIVAAREQGADLVTFPELALDGYPPEDLLLKPRFLEDSVQALRALAQGVEGIVAVVGFADLAGGACYNAAAVLSDGQVRAVYHKKELPNYEVFDEKRYFVAGDDCLLLEINGVRLMITVCEDIWVPDNEVEHCALRHRVQLALNISASPFHAGKLDLRRSILARFAQSTGAVVCYNNLVGGQDELVFDGGSLVIGPDGAMLACARRFAPELQVCDLELPPAREARTPEAQDFPRLRRVRLSAPGRRPEKTLAPTCAPEMSYLEEIHQALILGTRDYVQKNGFSKVVLGLSGGIDSALTACLAVQALGADNVVGVTMPSQFTSEGTRTDAGRVAANLGVRLITVPLANIYQAYLEELAQPFGDGQPGVAHENLQARIRGNILMGLSNRFGWLVLTTGNKSETAVGYCTLYGDMAGGFAVIKDVPKTLVYELSAYINRQAGRDLIPQSTIDRAPSAELRPDQKDTDSLPAYEVLDPILEAYVEQDMVLDEIAALGYDFATVREVIRLVDRNEYKRRQAPPGVKITPKAFGRDRRLPITNHYRPGFDR
ncbi:MAG: NAD+ synthase [Thermodesulfobacteriota bacterium]